MKFLGNRHAGVLSLVLAAQALVLYTAVSGAENVPVIPPLSEFPSTVGPWRTLQDVPIEKEVQDVLQADDTLNREYVDSTGYPASLFIGYFKSQRTGQSPHSPQNCLPGSGWEPLRTGFINISVVGRSKPVHANYYVVSHGNDKAVVIYWYQSHSRIIAGEYSAKFWLIADSIRYHRSDTALVRVVMPVVNNEDVQRATAIGVQFVQQIFPELARRLPA
jgi:EpsI family protein